jgi:hypothetical protein
VLLAGSSAMAQSEPASAPASAPASQPDVVPDNGPVEEFPVARDVNKQELGVRLGLALGVGGVSPGGLDVGGDWIYQLTEHVWFDGEATFLLGASDPVCYLARDRSQVCGTGALSGTAFEVRTGVVFFGPKKANGFVEFLRAGVGLGIVTLPGDRVTGVALPIWVAPGVRTRVTDSVALRGEGVFSIGPGFYGSAGTHSVATFLFQLGVDFAI